MNTVRHARLRSGPDLAPQYAELRRAEFVASERPRWVDSQRGAVTAWPTADAPLIDHKGVPLASFGQPWRRNRTPASQLAVFRVEAHDIAQPAPLAWAISATAVDNEGLPAGLENWVLVSRFKHNHERAVALGVVPLLRPSPRP